jgi:hypothetical protein
MMSGWIPKTPVSASQRCVCTDQVPRQSILVGCVFFTRDSSLSSQRFSLISSAYFVVFCVEWHGLIVQNKKVVQTELLVSAFASEEIYNGMLY